MSIIIGIKVSGPGGCGKSTWLNEIAAQLEQEGFSIFIDGDKHQLRAEKEAKTIKN